MPGGSSTRGRIARVLFEMTLDDAMGIPTGLWGRKRVKAFFGRTERFLDGPAENDAAFDYKRGQFTDGTGQTLVLLDSIASTDYESGTGDIVFRILAWAEKENAFENNILGPISKVALANFRDNTQDSRIMDKALSNGNTMRIVLVSCLFRLEQREGVTRYVYQVSRATYTNDAIITDVTIVVGTVSSAMVRDDFGEVMEDVFGVEKLGHGTGCETFSLKLGEHLKIGLDTTKAHRGGDERLIRRPYDVADTGVGIIGPMPATLSVVYFAQDPGQSCLLCTNMTGDIDTIGAIAAVVYGTFTGLGQIGQRYVEVLRQQNDAGFDHYVQILKKGRKRLT